ncbi:MAG: hypothetical protein PHP50_05140 [Lachnospiraceae bacterium]|nr:hypothetical protein [Lachnospiraceae bacterium]
MLVILLDWFYIAVVCTILGVGVLKLFNRLVGREKEDLSLMHNLAAGIVFSTVYAQYFSLFYRVSLLAQLLLLALCIFICFRCKDTLAKMITQIRSTAFSWQGILYLFLLLGVAFFTSRGVQHTDTGIYHAQAIRWIEEFGVVKGLGNMMGNYAYNSSYLCFAALFSMKFLCGVSLHTTNGLIAVSMCIYAFHRLKDFKFHTRHIADLLCVSNLFYALVIANTIMSPATDAPTMFMTIYFLIRFAEVFESEYPSYQELSLLSIGLVYVVTLKLSAGCIVLLVLSPAIILLQKKRWKEIGIYIGTGILVLLPFLLRNIILSGWLLYPFAAIDLFSFDWKIPIERVITDSDQIKVYGRCLYENNLINMPLKEWFPIWWGHQERYEQMLMAGSLLSLAGSFVLFLQKLLQKQKINWNIVLLHTTCIICAVAWFFTAPFVRYGLGFLLAYPMIYLGNCLFTNRMNLLKIGTGFCMFGVICCLVPYFDHYITDDLVFAKQNLLDMEYYVVQKDYEVFNTASYEMNGLTFYYPTDGDKAGYYGYPGASGRKDEQVEMRGDGLRDGFKVK